MKAIAHQLEPCRKDARYMLMLIQIIVANLRRGRIEVEFNPNAHTWRALENDTSPHTFKDIGGWQGPV